MLGGVMKGGSAGEREAGIIKFKITICILYS